MLITRFGLQGAAAHSQQGRRAGGREKKKKTRSETPFDPRIRTSGATGVFTFAAQPPRRLHVHPRHGGTLKRR